MTKSFAFLLVTVACAFAQDARTPMKSIRDFGVLPTSDAATNKQNLQKAIDWAADRGAALYVEPSDEGPHRKYYALNKRGRELLKSNTARWTSFSETLDRLIDHREAS